jgi:hypothetical protein
VRYLRLLSLSHRWSLLQAQGFDASRNKVPCFTGNQSAVISNSGAAYLAPAGSIPGVETDQQAQTLNQMDM